MRGNLAYLLINNMTRGADSPPLVNNWEVALPKPEGQGAGLVEQSPVE